MNSYRLGFNYKDKGGIKSLDDQFLRWINIPGSGMLNAPGIRPLKYKSLKITTDQNMPAFTILVTHEKSSGHLNPWDDIVDYANSEVVYWRDAKKHKTKRLLDFDGNKVLNTIHDYILDGNHILTPPILHFSKPEKGWVNFNGLCVLNKLETSWFDDHGTPVRNYRAHLTILDEEEVHVERLHHRVLCENANELDKHDHTPIAWKKYLKGNIQKISIWKGDIRSKEQQLPLEGNLDADILNQLLELDPYVFERVVVELFRLNSHITHTIEGTSQTGDGGFDFHGEFKIPRPFNYSINFLGEVKRSARSTAVDPKSVSKLVARLSRGQYGLFVTTSYFTPQAQREVLADAYPVKLISGADLIYFFRELGVVSKGIINPEWLKSVLDTQDS